MSALSSLVCSRPFTNIFNFIWGWIEILKEIFQHHIGVKKLNDFLLKQYTLIVTNSILPDFTYISEGRIDTISIEREDILAVIRNTIPNKATGSGEIFGQMLRIGDESVLRPLMIILQSILESSIYPDQCN